MISIIITAFKESKTIQRAIMAIAEQNLPRHEIIVIAPDKETLDEAEKLRNKCKNLKILQDGGDGKPAALNLAVSKAKGEILILTDGDVYVGAESIVHLIGFFKGNKIGAVSGKPVSTNPRDNMYGFWSSILTKTADEIRKKSSFGGRRFFCSGYLFAIRKELFPLLPKELLSEDGYISNYVYSKGYSIAYSEKSEVHVKYPNNFSDWIKQKKRSAGGYNQIKKLTGADMRSFTWESRGAFGMFKYLSNLREIMWLMALFLSRVYLWLVIFKDINIKKKSQKEIWKRVESTK